MKLVIHEDLKFDQLYPLTYLRPSFALRCGATYLHEKIERVYAGADKAYFVRDVLKATFKQKMPDAVINDSSVLSSDDDTILINGRVLAFAGDLPAKPEPGVYKSGDTVVIAMMPAAEAKKAAADSPESFIKAAEKLGSRSIDATMIDWPWNLVHHNAKAIEDDFDIEGKSGIEGFMHERSVIYGPKDKVFIAKGAQVEPMVVIDTNCGPVTIDEGAKVTPFSRIEGPCYIGKETQIVGGNIREGCAIGPVCRVGGEVEESIIHAYSNKYHDGFLGHAYVCEWVNLGAITTNSDLKNDYSTVSVYSMGEIRDTDDTKVGSFIGDHTKTSIGTMINTGTHIGVMCNCVGAGTILPKFVPSFAWFVAGKVSKGFGFKPSLATAKTAMGRRKVELTDADVELLTYTRQLTKEERTKIIKKARR